MGEQAQLGKEQSQAVFAPLHVVASGAVVSTGADGQRICCSGASADRDYSLYPESPRKNRMTRSQATTRPWRAAPILVLRLASLADSA
jgi:hypothetical protein